MFIVCLFSFGKNSYTTFLITLLTARTTTYILVMAHLAEYQLVVYSPEGVPLIWGVEVFHAKIEMYFTIVSLASGLLQIVPSAHGMC